MSAHFVGSVPAFTQDHIHCVFSCSMGVFGYLCHHIFEHASSSFDSSNFASRTFTPSLESIWSNTPLLCVPLWQRISFVQPAQRVQALTEGLQTLTGGWRAERLGLTHDPSLIMYASHANSVQNRATFASRVKYFKHVDANFVIDYARTWW